MHLQRMRGCLARGRQWLDRRLGALRAGIERDRALPLWNERRPSARLEQSRSLFAAAAINALAIGLSTVDFGSRSRTKSEVGAQRAMARGRIEGHRPGARLPGRPFRLLLRLLLPREPTAVAALAARRARIDGPGNIPRGCPD